MLHGLTPHVVGASNVVTRVVLLGMVTADCEAIVGVYKSMVESSNVKVLV
jgi:hypothetical protein